jgi:hypothetical protein
VQYVELEIFNSWGNKVFVGAGSDIGWDGKYKGKDCQNGPYAYTYTVRLKDTTYRLGMGTVILVR